MHTDRVVVAIHDHYCTDLRSEDIQDILTAVTELISSALFQNEIRSPSAA